MVWPDVCRVRHDAERGSGESKRARSPACKMGSRRRKWRMTRGLHACAQSRLEAGHSLLLMRASLALHGAFLHLGLNHMIVLKTREPMTWSIVSDHLPTLIIARPLECARWEHPSDHGRRSKPADGPRIMSEVRRLSRLGSARLLIVPRSASDLASCAFVARSLFCSSAFLRVHSRPVDARFGPVSLSLGSYTARAVL